MCRHVYEFDIVKAQCCVYGKRFKTKLSIRNYKFRIFPSFRCSNHKKTVLNY